MLLELHALCKMARLEPGAKFFVQMGDVSLPAWWPAGIPVVAKVRELNPDMAYDVPLDAAKIRGDDLRKGLVQSYFTRQSRRKLNKAAAAQGGVSVTPSDWK